MIDMCSADQSPATIRVIEHGPAEGAWNMAVDEALLATAAEQRSATLRLYRWQQPTLSFGYFQPWAERATHAASRACPVVRRHSGGGAIVHDRELTYSLSWPTGPRDDELAGRLYRMVHQSLTETLAEYGITARLHSGAPEITGKQPFLCFLRRAAGDVCLGDAKVLGSAQRRRRGAILQHGSLLWARSAAAPELPGLVDLIGAGQCIASLDEFVTQWRARLVQDLGITAEPAELSGRENSLARQLVAEKFSTARWNRRR